MISYISLGKLYLLPEDGPETDVSSDFIRDLRQRLQSIEDRREVFRGSGEAFMSGGFGGGQGPSLDQTFQAEFSCIANDPGTDGICYAIDAGEVRAMFTYEPEQRYERRVFHGPKQRFTSISVREHDDEILWLVAAAQDHGVSRICVFKPEKGSGVRDVTEGESLDAYPVWIPGEPLKFAYQTSGIARNVNTGEWMGLGPASIESVDLETRAMETLAANGSFDFLCPMFDDSGNLYFIRRPYEAFKKTSITAIAKDILMFPWRLVLAVFGFLNMFSMMFTGKPLKTAGNAPKREGPDPKAMFLHGRWVNVTEEMQRNSVSEDAPDSAVPSNWELIQQTPNGDRNVIAKGVMSFAVGPDNLIYYSNGKGIYTSDGKSKKPGKVSDRKMVTAIAIS